MRVRLAPCHFLASAGLVLGLHQGWAAPRLQPSVAVGDAGACLQAVATAERQAGLPPGLMRAIALVESGRPDPARGVLVPWPWSVDADGQSLFFDSKAEAVTATARLLASGARSVDIGCMQVNLQAHPRAFASLDQGFDPTANTAYAARFLVQLRAGLGGWPQAVAAYHSQDPDAGRAYLDKVNAAGPVTGPAPAPGLPDEAAFTPGYAALLRQARADSSALQQRRGHATPPLSGHASR